MRVGHLDLALGDAQRLRGDAGQHGIETLADLGPRVQDADDATVVRRDLHVGNAGAGVAVAEGRRDSPTAHRGDTAIDDIGVRPEALRAAVPIQGCEGATDEIVHIRIERANRLDETLATL